MSTVARHFTASPARLSSATWQAISGLICKSDRDAAAEFAKVGGLASSLINEKFFADNPLVLKNKGPRLRVYCIYGEDAITGEDANESDLTWSPTSDEWQAFLPCSADEYDEMTASLKGKSVKFSIYNIEKGIPDDTENEMADSAAAVASVDWGAFKKL
jgi:hypothetical protein